MKNLPKIYQADISKRINNNKTSCYLEHDEAVLPHKMTSIEIENTILEIFSGLGEPYNIPVTIKTKNKEYNTSLISKTKTKIMTLDNDIIPITEIISIKKNG